MSEWRDHFEDPRAAIGSAAISADAPAGGVVRGSDSYTALEDEFRKLETEGPSAVHWPAVRDGGLAILRDEGKDLLPACWLAYALFRTEGFAGLATGLLILDGMCSAYWDEMQPPPARARGRVGAFDWLSERLGPLIEKETPAPSDDLTVVTAFEAAESVARTLEEKLALETTIAVLVRALRTMATTARTRLEAADAERNRAEAAVAAAEDTSGGASAVDAGAQTTGETGQPNGANAAAAPPPGASPPPAPSPVPAAAASSGNGAAAVPAVDLSSGDVGRAVSQLADAMRQVARMLRQASIADPRAYSLSRTAIWSRVAELPEVDNGRTGLPAPDSDAMAFLEQTFAAGGYAAVVEQAEEMQADSPFWLTASRWSASALRKLGPDHEAAAAAVEGQTAVFLSRYPDLTSMSFSDGTPFTDPETVSWLQSTRSGGGTGGGDPTAEAVVRARALLAGGKGGEAMGLLASEGRKAPSGRDRFSWQLAQATLCLDAGRIAEAVALTDHLISRSRAVDLADWDPGLVAMAAETRLKALQHETAATIFAEEDLARRKGQARVDLVQVDAARAFGAGV